MIDLHSHILPGLDDGARDMDFAIEMAKMAVADGVCCVAATPHNVNGFRTGTRAEVWAATTKLREALRAQDIALEIVPGVEARIGPDLSQQLDAGRAFPIGQTRYILLELPLVDYPTYTERVIFELQVRGLVPILAHPERNEVLRKKPELLQPLMERGCLSQLTAASLVGVFGEETRRVSVDMLERNLAHVIASDAHTLSKRSSVLSEAVKEASRIMGEDRARALVTTVPQAILDDREVQVEAPLDRRASRGRWLWSR